MKKALLALLFLWPLTAQAQTVTKAPASTIPTFGTPCTTLQCTGLTGGAWIAPGIIGADFGLQYWNSIAFLGAEIGVGGQVYTNPANTLNENGLFMYQIGKVGGSLTGLLGATPAAPSNFPSIAANIIAPYGLAGAVERNITGIGFQSGWTVGGGIEYDISAHLFADAKFMYNNYGGARLPAETLVLAGVNYKF